MKMSKNLALFLCSVFITNITLADNQYTNVSDLHAPAIINKTEELPNSCVLENEATQMFFDIYASKKPEDHNYEKVLNNNVYSDLEFYSSDEDENTKAQTYLLNTLDNNETLQGKAYFAKMLYQPTTNIEKLKNRQAIVKELVENKELFNLLDTKVKQIKEIEGELIWFWKELEKETTTLLEQPYPPKAWPEGLKTNSIFLNGYKRTRNFLSVGTCPLMQAFFFGWLGTKLFKNTYTQKIMWKEVFKLVKGTFIPPKEFFDELKKLESNKFRFLQCLPYIVLYSVNGFFITKGILNIRKDQKVINDIHQKMNHVAKYMFCMRSIDKIIEKNESLAKLFSCTKNIPQACDSSKTLSKTLESRTFRRKPAYLSNVGAVLSSFKLMQKESVTFIKAIKTVGKIDAYLSIAKLYKKLQENPNAKYCFVDYCQKDKPYISLSNFWNPMLNPDTVVTNNLELSEATGNNAIITGPNAGGKSTILKAVITNLILGQTIGIASADKMEFTPFAKINSYLNISDKIGNKSLYQAEMRRAMDLLNSITALKPNELCFVMMDEIFTGTNAEEGQAGAYGIAKALADFNNTCCMLATHYKALTELEQDTNGKFKNYKVSVAREDGVIKPIYKIEPGVSDQKIALDLLKAEGFDSTILENAAKFLNRPAAA